MYSACADFAWTESMSTQLASTSASTAAPRFPAEFEHACSCTTAISPKPDSCSASRAVNAPRASSPHAQITPTRWPPLISTAPA